MGHVIFTPYEFAFVRRYIHNRSFAFVFNTVKPPDRVYDFEEALFSRGMSVERPRSRRAAPCGLSRVSLFRHADALTCLYSACYIPVHCENPPHGRTGRCNPCCRTKPFRQMKPKATVAGGELSCAFAKYRVRWENTCFFPRCSSAFWKDLS